MGGRKLRVIPDRGEGGAVVHGRIDDENRPGYTGLEVRIENERGETIRRTETDESGYYSFTLDKEETESLEKKLPKGVYISVCDKEGARISRTSEPVPVGNDPVINFSLKKTGNAERRKTVRLPPKKK